MWCVVCGAWCGVFHQAAEPVLPVLQTVLVQEHLRRGFFIDNLLVRIHFIIVMIRWTGLAPWRFTANTPSIDRCLCAAKWRQLVSCELGVARSGRSASEHDA